MSENNIKEHIDNLQQVAIDTVTNPIKDGIKLSVGVLGLSFTLIKGFSDKILNLVTIKEENNG